MAKTSTCSIITASSGRPLATGHQPESGSLVHITIGTTDLNKVMKSIQPDTEQNGGLSKDIEAKSSKAHHRRNVIIIIIIESVSITTQHPDS